MNPKSIFWGVFFILAAVLVVVSQFGVFAGGIGLWTILASAALLAIIIKSIPSRNFSGILIPLAVGYVLYEKPLGWPHISWWILFGAAILMSIGLQMLFRKKPEYNWDYSSTEWGNCKSSGANHVHIMGKETDYTVMEGEEGAVQDAGQPDMKATHGGDDNHPYATVKLGAASKYIYGSAVETGYFKSSMGALEVYFDSATLAPGGADIFVDANLGAVTLYIPKGWRVRPELNVVLGGVDDQSPGHAPDPTAPELRISGNVTLAGLELKYV